MKLTYPTAPAVGCPGEAMDTKKKNLLTAAVLIIVALTIYVFAVIRAMSQ